MLVKFACYGVTFMVLHDWEQIDLLIVNFE